MTAVRRLTPGMALQLANPRSWLAALFPAVFGEWYCLFAGYDLAVWKGIVLLVACVLMQSSVNTLNDYFDFIKGTDTRDDCLEASDAVLLYAHADPKQALLLGIGFLAAAALLAAPVIWEAGPAPLVIGVAGGIIVLTYSGGILPVSYLPIGEVVSGVVMGGLIPLGIVAAVSGTVAWPVFLGALPLMFGIGLIMMTNNTCDIEKDRIAGRHTLPVLLGRGRSVFLYRCGLAVWLALLCGSSYAYLGWQGLSVPVLIAIAGRRVFGRLFRSRLIPQERIGLMKGIVLANLAGSGMYLAVLLAVLAGGGIHG